MKDDVRDYDGELQPSVESAASELPLTLRLVQFL